MTSSFLPTAPDSSAPLRGSGNPVFRTNVFLLLLHCSIVSLLGLGVFAWQWGQNIPKTLELKIYALLLCIAVVWLFVARRIAPVLSKDAPLFWIFLSVYFPLVAILNSLPDESESRTVILFLTGLAGFLLLVCEYGMPASEAISRSALRTLHTSIVLSVLLTVLLSVGTTFNLLSFTAVFFFGLSWMMLEKVSVPLSDALFALAVSLVLLPVFFWVRVGYIDLEHYAYVLGPIVEAVHGHKPLAEIAPQYGGGMTVALSWFFQLLGQVTNIGLVALLRVLTALQFLLVFFVSWSMARSRALAICALLSALLFEYCSQGDKYFAFPSIGFLRFGFPLLIAGLYCIPNEGRWRRFRPHTVAILAAVASFWSFESMVYTLPAVCAAEWTGKRLRSFLPLLIACVIIVWGAYWISLLLTGHHPDFFQYIEYPSLFAGGYGQIPLERQTAIWWLFVPIALYGVAQSLWDDRPDERVMLLSVYALAIFTYFIGRAHPNNLYHVSVPFIILIFSSLSRISSLRWQSVFSAAVLTIMLSLNVSFFEVWPMLHGMAVLLRASVQETMGSLPKPVFDDCARFEGFRPYVRSDRFALLDQSLSTYDIHACLGAANAFGIDPFDETAISPRAIDRAAAMARSMPVQPVLIAADDTTSRPLTLRVLRELVLTKKQAVTIAGTPYWLYEGRGIDTSH